MSRDWLGVSSQAHALEAMGHPERSPFACLGPVNARFGNDPSFLNAPKLRTYTRKEENLDDPLSWDEELGFSKDVRGLAELLGY